jgi:molybdopterin converting factor small subunit
VANPAIGRRNDEARSIMLTVRFFASIRERLNTGQLQMPPARNVDALITMLGREYGAQWEEILRAGNVIIAVNQRVTDSGEPLHNGDELAFFRR